MPNKKQPAKKRAYKKRKNISPKEVEINNYNLVPVKATNKDTEVESLALICSIFDNWNDDQKRRNLQYLCGRYYDFK